MIQSLSSLTHLTPLRGSRPAQAKPAESLPQAEDTVSISSSPKAKSSGWISGLSKTAILAGLAACLAGPLVGSAHAQCYPQHQHRQRTVAVQVNPYGGVHVGQQTYRHGTTTSVGISIGPGGVQVQASVQPRNPWGYYPPVVMPQPPVVVYQQPQVVVVQPPPVVVYQQPRVIYQQPVILAPSPWGY